MYLYSQYDVISSIDFQIPVEQNAIEAMARDSTKEIGLLRTVQTNN